MKKSTICDILNIEYPIFQGAMAWISDGELAGSVSAAGGLGIIAAMNADSKWLKEQIKIVREQTDNPFGVNIMLRSEFCDDIAKVVIEEKVPVVVTGAGNPSKYMKDWLDAGIKVIPVISAVKHAVGVEAKGATAVIAEGMEAGGHIGSITTMSLVPQVCDAVKIPVIAAGGIADGRGVAAAFMLGAIGVQIGTRFLLSKECNIHEEYKNQLINANDTATMTTGNRLGHPVRALSTQFSKEFRIKEYDSSITNAELEELVIGTLRYAAVDGNLEKGSFMSGQIVGMCNKKETSKEIIDNIMGEVTELLSYI